MIAREIASFFAALRFLTRLPGPRWVGSAAQGLERSAPYFPLVGALVGAIGAAVASFSARLWPHPVAIALSMGATAVVTGAFHEDGLSDAADGFGGGWTREDILRIMKDSRVGSFGVVALVLVLLTKFALLESVAAPGRLAALMIAGHAASRLAPVALIFVLDYARNETGKARPVATGMTTGRLALAGVFGCAPSLTLPPGPALAALVFCLGSAALAGRFFHKRIGGYTGDCLGATQQISEIAFYLGATCGAFS
jgi:adenosylcobinamide-GDP ribazoletransferase